MSDKKSSQEKRKKLLTQTSWLFSNAPTLVEESATPQLASVSSANSPAPMPGTQATSAHAAENNEQNGEGTVGVGKEFSEEFEVLERIGEGAICDVYAVRNKALKQTFALKLLKEDVVSNPAAVKQFKKEIDAAVFLTHANIAAVYGHGQTSQGAPFVLQHLCEGSSLAELMKKEGKLDPDRALNILLQICEGMTHAHMKAVIHRDLKPSNIVISSDSAHEVARLIDFGMSSVLQSARSAVTDVTRTGEIFGTPHYMSPEQCMGYKVDERSDIYSFGCLMYEVLNGRTPYGGINPVQVIMKHIQESVPAFDRPSSPFLRSLEQIVYKCMEKVPANRYQTFDDVRLDLQSVQDGVMIEHASGGVFPGWKARLGSSILDGFFICALTSMLLFPLMPYLKAYQPLLDSIANAGYSSWLFYWSPELFSTRFFSSFEAFGPMIVLLFPIIACLYHVVCESTPMRGTIAQNLMGLGRVNARGERMSPLHSFARFWLMLAAPFCLLYEKLALRNKDVLKQWPMDRITSSYLVNRKNMKLVETNGVSVAPQWQSNLTRAHTGLKHLNRSMLFLALFGCFLGYAFVVESPPYWALMQWCIALLVALGYRNQLTKSKQKLMNTRGSRDIAKAVSLPSGIEAGALSQTGDFLKRLADHSASRTDADKTLRITPEPENL